MGEWKQNGTTFPLTLKKTDKASEVRRPQMDMREKIGPRHPRLVRFFQEEPSLARDLADLSTSKVMPKGRNFH